jgi:hypothetical protein
MREESGKEQINMGGKKGGGKEKGEEGIRL